MTVSVPSIPRGGDAGAGRPMPNAGYLRPDSAGTLKMPAPAVRDANTEVRIAYRRAAGYASDAIHNSGWIAGAIDQVVTDTNGTGLKLSAKPNARALGWSEERANDWAIDVEEAWNDWSHDPFECDARGQLTIDQMADAGVRFNYPFGEFIATNEYIDRAGADTLLKIKMHWPMALTTETNRAIRLEQGVFKNRDGMPVGYRFHRETDFGEAGTIDILARDSDGRPNVVHVFDGMPGQTRGITPLAPILKVARQYDQLADATLTAALIQTIFAASLKSDGLTNEAFGGLLTDDEQDKMENGLSPLPLPPGAPDLSSYIAAQVKWYEQFNLNLGAHGRMAHLFPGQSLEFHNNNHPNENYLPFTRNLLREIARMIGVTYESLSLDHEGSTYSSILMGVATIWPIAIRRRQRLPVPFKQAVYRAFLDEMIFRRRISFPGGYSAYLENQSAASRASWRGPAKPRADELKSARAQSERLENNTSSISAEANENGIDVEDLARQKRRDIDIHARHGLPNPSERDQSQETLNNDGEREDEAA